MHNKLNKGAVSLLLPVIVTTTKLKVSRVHPLFQLRMFEAFGFSVDLPTVQKFISATFEYGHFGG